MEEKNKQKDSSSSFVYELFGPKDTHPSSCGVFGSMFSSQSPNVVGRESLRLSEVSSEKTIKERWDYILGVTHDGIPKGYGGLESLKTQTKDKSSIYEDQIIEPCNSIYYGGQDIFPHAHNIEGRNSLPKNNGEGDDLASASRGDWWKGSLYY